MITTFNEVHLGHELSRSSYESHPRFRRVSKSDIDKYGKYACNLKVPNHIIREQVFKDTGKMLKNQDVVNIKHKFLKDRDSSDINKCLSMLKDKSKKDGNSNLQISYEDSSGTKVLKCIFWQSSHMRELFKDFCSVLFMDGTYNLTNRGYILVTVSVKDNHDQGRLIAWALLSQESKVVMTTMLECLCVGNREAIEKIRYVVIDKDFSEIAALHKILPQAHFVICRYHAINAVVAQVSRLTLDTSEQKYKQIFTESFMAMVYANTEEEYMCHWDRLCSIKGSKQIEHFIDYLDKYWHSIRDHWAFYVLKTKELFNSFTNNRSEALNKTIKSRITRNSKFEVVVSMLFNIAGNQEKSLLLTDSDSRNKLYKPFDVIDVYHEEIIRLGNNLVTKEVLRCLEHQYKTSSLVDLDTLNLDTCQVKCPKLSGPCTYYSTNRRPCAHLLAVRKFHKEIMLTPEMFMKHWLQKSARTVLDGPTEKKENIFKKMLDKKEKFVTINKVCKDIACTVSGMKKTESEYNLQVLSQVESAIKKGTQISFDGRAIETVVDQASSGKDFEFDNSQDPVFKHTQKGSGKKRKLSNGNDLLPWQEIINKTIRKIDSSKDTWDASAFNTFSGTGWLSDTHMGYFCALMQKQFPEIICHEPFDYQILAGFPPTNGNKFIQIVHSGTDHWAVLTNIGISEEKRQHEVIVYDSLIHLQGKSCLVKPAVEWQACQLLRNGTDPHPSSIIIHTYPCQQQDNGYDCGVFALANSISLCFDLKPEKLQYLGNVRKQLMDILLNGTIVPLKSKVAETFQKSTVLSNIHTNVSLVPMHKRIDALCYCRMPESYGDIVQCHRCHLYFHAKCFLIGTSRRVFAGINEFVCFGCRQIGDYAFIAAKWKTPDMKACERVAKAIDKLVSNKCSVIARVKSIQAEKLFSTQAQYTFFEQFIVKYDLNRVCTKTGEIFNAIYNFYSNADSNIAKKYPFDSLSLSEIFRLAVLLICKVENIALPPYVVKENYFTLHAAIQSNKKWISTLRSTGLKLKKTIGSLVSAGGNYMENQDKVSEVMSELTALSVFLGDAKTALNNEYKASSASDLKKQKELLDCLKEIDCWVVTMSEDMERFKNK